MFELSDMTVVLVSIPVVLSLLVTSYNICNYYYKNDLDVPEIFDTHRNFTKARTNQYKWSQINKNVLHTLIQLFIQKSSNIKYLFK